MSNIETKFSRVAHFEAQGTGQQSRYEKDQPDSIDVVRGNVGDKTLLVALPMRNKAILETLGPDVVELKIDNQTQPHVAAALAHAAFSELVTNGEKVNIVAFAPYHADNHELDSAPMDPLYGTALGMDGGGMTAPGDQLMYVGDSRQMLDSATETLSYGRRPFLPGKAA